MTSTHNDAPVKEALNFKIIIIGDAGVGKTSLLHYFIFNKCTYYCHSNAFIYS